MSSPPILHTDFVVGESSKQTLEEESCQLCKKKDKVISTLTIRLIETMTELHTTSTFKDIMIDRKKKIIQDLLNHVKEVTRKIDKVIGERNNIIAEKESLIAKNDNLIAKLQIEIQLQGAEVFGSEPIDPTQTQ